MQAEGEEAVQVPAQPEDGPGLEHGGGPEHRHGLGREAEGGAALLRVREALLHQRAGARGALHVVSADRGAAPLKSAHVYKWGGRKAGVCNVFFFSSNFNIVSVT